MFGFLKDTLKGALSVFSKKVEAEAAPVLKEEVKEEVKEEIKEETKELAKEEIKEAVKEEVKEETKEPAKEEIKAEVKEEIKEEIKEAVKEEIKEEPKKEILKENKHVEKKPIEAKPAEVKPVEIKKEVKKAEKIEEKKVEVKKEEVKVIPKVVEKKIEVNVEEKKVEKKVEVKIEEKKPIVESPKVEEKKSEEKIESKEEKKGFFSRLTSKISEAVTTTSISESKFDDLFWDLEVVLLENNVAVEVIDKIKSDLKQSIVDKPIHRGKVEETVMSSLKSSISGLFEFSKIDLLEKAKSKKPFVICFVGVNGSGKTTSIAKVANLLLKNKLSVVLAAADTFRAAAIDQLQLHADKLGVKLIRYDYGADAAAVAFDAVKYAQAKSKDVVLIDTAGRLHSNHNLVEEMKKIVRVSKPDMIVFVGESITGNDCVEQAKQFNEAVNIDGIILSKADIDEKGGAAISVSYVTKKPILYIGTGQEYDDLEVFNKDKVLASVGL